MAEHSLTFAAVGGGTVGDGLVPSRAEIQRKTNTGRDKPVPYEKAPMDVGSNRSRWWFAPCPVGATLVVARLGHANALDRTSTGDHKGRPYDQLRDSLRGSLK